LLFSKYQVECHQEESLTLKIKKASWKVPTTMRNKKVKISVIGNNKPNMYTSW
jgi:hypothetical protein